MEWVWEWAKQQGAEIVVLCLCIYGLIRALLAVIKGDVVPKWTYEESTRREEAWRVLYERERATAERLINERNRREQERTV